MEKEDIKLEKYKDSITLSNKLGRLLWNVCCLILFRPFAGPLFWRWRNVVLRLFGAKVGAGCKVSNSAKIWAPWNLELGRMVCLGPGCKIYSADKICIDDKVTISQGAYLCSASHDISSLNKPLITAPVKIERFAWICADAFVGMGVTIGEGAVVGARAAVFKDVEPWTVVGGNPARVIKKRVIKD
ncbi:MAG: putative colanic acid biosynthesis acetyltransferase [Bacteroidales bacterium]|nr:putative colanic acid biosynthesis acetyltransferase [Bacteroidales bacterium]